ncbi:methyltransferase domain-containing protein [Spiribacter insolitus]|uniref:Class I SAM-dependent methyltransferase n=1 Tax=Spiribacter insolitus TaxID=3122417 RepID=A0ABV3T4M2_9GAMM
MPEQFAADWLALREPADHAARPDLLTQRLGEGLPVARPLRIADLGAGAGSNLRYLAPRLPQPQQWWLIDHDRELLTRASATATAQPPSGAPDDLTITAHAADLAEFPSCLPAAVDLITASALLDLVTEDWIERLADYCTAHGLPALLALSFDGRMALSPALPDDALVKNAVLEHQRSEKDMGRALGPDAAATVDAAFTRRGATVIRHRSDWHLTPAQAPLQRLLLQGWHEAAMARRPAEAGRLDAWLAARMADIDHSHIRVGHQDVLSLPCRG